MRITGSTRDHHPTGMEKFPCPALGRRVWFTRHAKEQFTKRTMAEDWTEARLLARPLLKRCRPVKCWQSQSLNCRKPHDRVQFPDARGAIGRDGWVFIMGDSGGIVTALCADEIVYEK